MSQLYLMLLGAHCCGDFLVYSHNLSEKKRTRRIRKRLVPLSIHCSFHFIWVWIWLWPYDYFYKIYASLLIFFVHLLIDLIRPYIENSIIPAEEFVIFENKFDVISWFKGNANGKVKKFLDNYFLKWFFINLFDQGLHVISILFISWYLTRF